MKILLSISVLFLIGFTNLSSQQVIQSKAQEFADAFVKAEFLKVAEWTHPDVVAKSGGMEYIMEDLKSARVATTEQGLVYNSAKVLEPQKILMHEGEIQTIVPVDYELQLMDKKYKNTSYILAISKDDGETYSFVNLLQFDQESLEFFIENLNPDIKIPNAGDFVEIQN